MHDERGCFLRHVLQTYERACELEAVRGTPGESRQLEARVAVGRRLRPAGLSIGISSHAADRYTVD